MRRALPFVLCALAFAALVSGGAALADDDPTPTTTPTTDGPTTTMKPTTTTQAPVTPTTSAGGSTTTTAKTPSGTTTTTAKSSGNPIPPPPSGASQPLDPSILGDTPLIDTTSTTLFEIETETAPRNTVSDDPQGVAVVNASSNKPNGTTLALATIAWLASLGGLLVYAEDQRGLRWRHLAR